LRAPPTNHTTKIVWRRSTDSRRNQGREGDDCGVERKHRVLKNQKGTSSLPWIGGQKSGGPKKTKYREGWVPGWGKLKGAPDEEWTKRKEEIS